MIPGLADDVLSTSIPIEDGNSESDIELVEYSPRVLIDSAVLTSNAF